MRTDPRADEVRDIVERVFSDYLRHKMPRRLAAVGNGERRPSRFPRIFQPWEESPAVASRPEAEPEIDETILVDQGRYVARSYRMPGYLAMWLVEVGLVQFYDDAGRMLATINLFQSLRPQSMAA